MSAPTSVFGDSYPFPMFSDSGNRLHFRNFFCCFLMLRNPTCFFVVWLVTSFKFAQFTRNLLEYVSSVIMLNTLLATA